MINFFIFRVWSAAKAAHVTQVDEGELKGSRIEHMQHYRKDVMVSNEHLPLLHFVDMRVMFEMGNHRRINDILTLLVVDMSLKLHHLNRYHLIGRKW